jgi:hypothetical protein
MFKTKKNGGNVVHQHDILLYSLNEAIHVANGDPFS